MAVSFNNLAYSASMANSVYNKMRKTNREIDRTIGVLSSSFKINSASDDAAGLAVSERMRAEMSGLEKAMSNMQDGLSMLQTADGGLQGISSIIQRMRELAVQSASDTLTESDRAIIQSEFGEIRQEINRITDTTQFNEKKLLNGSTSALWSSSDSDVHVILRGSIRESNQYGENISAEGNYDINITAQAGQSEILKSGQFLIHEEAKFETFNGIEGSGVYYDSDGNQISMSEAIKNFGFASWINPEAGVRDGTTYTFDLIDAHTGSSVKVLTTIYSSDFSTPQGFVDFMNSESTRSDRKTLYGTDYEAYFNKKTGKLGIRSSHDFIINDAAGGFQRLFGTITESNDDDDSTSPNTGSSPVTTSTYSASSSNQSIANTPVTVSDIPPDVGAGDTVTISDDDSRTLGGEYANIIVNANANASLTMFNLQLSGNITIGQNANLTLNLMGNNNRLGTNGQGTIILSSGSSLTIEGSGSQSRLNGLIRNTSGGTVTINSGTINSQASTSNTAGIYNPEGATLIVNGGSITAKGGSQAAGIGGESEESAGTVVINDGTVRATGGSAGAGIGGGYIASLKNTIAGTTTVATSGTITINGGTVTAISPSLGAGIGGGQHMNNGTVNINGGTVTATSGGNGTGIGGGSGGDGGIINITGGTVIAESRGDHGAGIGGGASTRTHSSAGTITISGGDITAKGGQDGAGIGSGNRGYGGTINITGGTINAQGGLYGAGIGAGIGARSSGPDDILTINISDGNITAKGGSNGAGIGGGQDSDGGNITISGGNVSATGGINGAGIGGGLNGAGGDITITGGRIDSTSGSGAASIGGGVNGGSGTLSITDTLFYDDNTGTTKVFNELGGIGYIGAGQTIIFLPDALTDSGMISMHTPENTIVSGDLTLRELDNFYDEQGKFILDDPRKITLIQGDGKTASVMLYADDTLDSVADKLNSAISGGLGQAKYADNTSKFVTFVEGSTKGSEAVDGTMIVRSAIAGKRGEIKFSGDEDILKALAINKIQDASENEFNITIRDAHTKKNIGTEKTTGNRAVGVINQNIDIDFDVMTGITASWDENSKKFSFSTHSYNSTVHISDNSVNLQAGANEGESINFSIGDMSTRSLKLDTLDVASRESAAESITVIDDAADKVSSQSAKVGALINRLEHSISAASVMHENVTESESKIRDADMAREYMNFTKLNIMLNARQSVFSQANQMSNNVLTLLR